MSSITSVTWNSGGVNHSEVFALGYNNTVSMSKDGGSFVSEGGYLTAISAGLDSAGNPEVYGIGGDNAVWVDDNGAGWVSRGGYVKAISASVNNTVFAIGGDNAVWVDGGGAGWTDLGGDFKTISAGLDSAGNPEVFAIGTNNAVYSNDNGAGWVNRAGYVTAISASTNNTVFAIGGDNAVYMNQGGTVWSDLGGYARQISAGSDVFGNPEVYWIGGDAATYVSDNGSAFGRIGGYVTDISGAGMGTVYARGGDVEQVFVSQYALPFNYVSSVALADPASGTAYSPAPASAQLFNNEPGDPYNPPLGEPSYLDVEQGVVGDCWLEASLAEVAARDPQDIKNMFVYDGTTVDNGSTVGLYSVRFFSPDGVGFYIQVDTALPSGGEYYDHVDNALGTQALWVALAEKGYAEANALGLVTTNNEYQGSYNALGGGDPAWALHAITGNPASDYSINPTNIASAWNSGDLIVLWHQQFHPAAQFLHCGGTNHCYAVVGYNASSSQPFEVFNPWGTDSSGWAPGHSGTIYGLFTANAAFISQNFVEQSVGTGAINVNNVTEPVNALTGSATGNGGYTRTGTINLTRPAQGTATGVDLWLASYVGDGDDPTTIGFRARRNGRW